MGDEVEVTERGEIVLCEDFGEVWTSPVDDEHVNVFSEGPFHGPATLTKKGLAAWCRRVIAEVDADPVPTVDEAAIRAGKHRSTP